MEAVAIGSLLSGGASAVAGSGTLAVVTGAAVGAVGPIQTGITFGQIATGFAAASSALSAFQGFQAQRGAASAAEASSREAANELRLQAQQEKTQSAIEAAERERRARRVQAAQRASFAGRVDTSSGTPALLQDQVAGQINREGRIADLSSGLTVSRLGRQASSEIRAGSSRASSIRSKASSSLVSSLGGSLDQIASLRETT